jgi:putative peptidoglycan lipid II flippase
MDSTKSIFKSASHFFSGTMLSRISGATRDITMAFAFGTKETVAGFFIAFRLAHLLRRLFGEGALQSAFVPKFEKLRSLSPTRAAHFFTSLYALLAGFLVLLITASSGLLYAYLPSFSEGNLEIAQLTLLMMPSLFFICLWGLNCSLLQCEKSFFLPSVSPVAFNAIWISGALGIWFTKSAHPMQWLAYTIVAACIIQWLITVPKTLKILQQWGLPRPNLSNHDIRSLAKPLFLGMLGVAAVQINSALDPLFARLASTEGPAYLWYAIRIQQVPLALFGIALSSALLPPLSRALESNNMEKYHRFFRFALRRSFWIMIPATLVLIFLGKWRITTVYGHGRFTETSVDGTTLCLSGYALGLLPMALVLIYAPAFYSRGNYFIPSMASSLSVLVNIAFNSLFVIGMGYGPASVAVATSISAWANFAIVALAFHRSKSLTLDTLKQ